MILSQAIYNGLDIEMGTPSNKNISKRYPYNNNFLGLSFFRKNKHWRGKRSMF